MVRTRIGNPRHGRIECAMLASPLLRRKRVEQLDAYNNRTQSKIRASRLVPVLQLHPATKLTPRSSSPHGRDVRDSGSAPRIILGMSVSHDTGAVVLRDGELVAAINEERLTRVKQAAGAPLESVPAILECAQISASEVDVIALSGRIALGDMPVNSDLSLEDGSISVAQRAAEAIDAFPGGAAIMRSSMAIAAYRSLMPYVPQARVSEVRDLLRQQGVKSDVVGNLRRFDHHDAHLASAYYASGESDCLV